MSIIAEYRFAGGAAVGNPGSPKAKLQNVTAQTLSPPPSLAGWGKLTEGVALPAKSHISIIPSGSVSRDSFAAEIAFAPGDAPGKQELFRGSTFVLIVHVKPVKGGVQVSAQLPIGTDVVEIVAPQPLPKGQMTALAVTYTGDDFTIAVDGEVVVRRALHAAWVSVGNDVGPFSVHNAATVAGIRLGTGIPASVAASLEAARKEGMGEIESLWLRLGGGSGWVGKATGTEQKIGTGRARRYANALLCWSPTTGPHEVHGAILATYESLTGPAGSFGYPVSSEVATPGVEGGRWNRFQAGAIAWSKSTGAHEVHGAILRHWLDLDGPEGVMGLPTSDELEDANGGRRSEFSGGTIHYSARTDARAVWGAIKQRYDSLGAAGGFLGYPVSIEDDVRNGAGKPFGRVGVFQGGLVLWSGATGAHEVHGAILALYRSLGGPSSSLGLPTREEQAFKSGVRMSEFQHGVIGWTAKGGARVIDRLECVLASASAPRVVDNLNEIAEIYAFATVKVDGKVVPGWDKRRAPKTGHSSKEVQFDHTPIAIKPLRLATKISLDFKAYDFDSTSGDDALGAIIDTWGADTMWGLTRNSGIHDSVGKGGDGDVHYTYRMTSPWEIDKSKTFREQQWWNFANPDTPSISWDQATEAFSDLHVHSSKVDSFFNPLDTVFYKYVLKGLAKKGNCHGMTVQAAIARLHGCPFPEPLVQFTDAADPVILHWLNRRHMSQVGAASIDNIIDAVAQPTRLLPSEVFARVKLATDAGHCCALSFFNLADRSGHTVLAYDCDAGNPNTIFVADPNVPLGVTRDDNVSRVEITGETFQFFDTNGASKYRSKTFTVFGATLPAVIMLEQSETVMTAPVRTPFAAILAGLSRALGGLLMLTGEIAPTQVSNGSATLLDPSPEPGRSRIRPNGMPGMMVVPMSDVEDAPFMVAQRGPLPDALTIEWQATAKGAGSIAARSAALDVRVDLHDAGGPGAQGSLALRRVHSGRPQAAIRGRDGLVAQLATSVLADRRGRPDRHYAVSLPLKPDASARLGPSESGGGVFVSVPGGTSAVKIAMAVRQSDGKVQRRVIDAGPLQPREELVCRPMNSASPLGDAVVERRGGDHIVINSHIVSPQNP